MITSSTKVHQHIIGYRRQSIYQYSPFALHINDDYKTKTSIVWVSLSSTVTRLYYSLLWPSDEYQDLLRSPALLVRTVNRHISSRFQLQITHTAQLNVGNNLQSENADAVDERLQLAFYQRDSKRIMAAYACHSAPANTRLCRLVEWLIKCRELLRPLREASTQ